ncbi:hypothetical protein ACFU0X_20455 [Streptomyces cellulosae]|uniref:Uncharacterized protein n=1 Tax=Streptomyces cellulosae TaxID=1968 RepID=A0ABW6JJ32_STRCE
MGPHTSTTTPLTRSSRTRPRPRWTVTLTCPRPANRAADDFHLAQHRIDGTVRRLLGRDAQLTLTPNQVRLVRKSTTAPDLARWQEELALVLSCLYLDTRTDDGRYMLPRPVRTDVLEEDTLG